MNTARKKDVRLWVGQNIAITLDALEVSDADALLSLARERTKEFFDLAEQGLRLSRKRANLPPPTSRREVNAFLLEFRIKIQMVHDRLQGLPDVPLFDLGGYRFLNCNAFIEAKMLYSAMGGLA